MSAEPIMMTEDQVIRLIKARTAPRGQLTAFANDCDVTPGYICQILSRRTPISDRVLERLGLRCETVTRYVPRATPVFITTRKATK
jgi:hypothetical protein